MKKLLGILFFVLGFTTFLVLPFLSSQPALAQETSAQQEAERRIQFPEIFPEEDQGLEDFRVYIRNFYVFAIGAALLIATVLIMIGGFIWVTSAGNQQRVSQAQSYITQSVIGVVLLMSAYLILRLINPALVELKLPTFPEIGSLGACIDEKGDCISPIEEKDCQTPKTFIPTTCEDRAQIIAEKGRENIDLILNLRSCEKQSPNIDTEQDCKNHCLTVNEYCSFVSFNNSKCECKLSDEGREKLNQALKEKESIDKLVAKDKCTNRDNGFTETETNLKNIYGVGGASLRSTSMELACKNLCQSKGDNSKGYICEYLSITIEPFTWPVLPPSKVNATCKCKFSSN